MGKASDKHQKKAIAEHRKGKKALAKGNIEAAFSHDDKSEVEGIAAMMLRLQGK